VHRSRPPTGATYWRWHCRWCGEYGGGQGHHDALSRALRHCAEHPYHLSSLVPGSRCAQRWPLLAVGPLEPTREPTVYDQLVAAQQPDTQP
jgi:hypothetical protein